MRRTPGLGFAAQLLASEAAPSNTLPLASIKANAQQPRRHFDPAALQELADSISAHGMLQPITVRPLEDGTHEIIAGERRWRAAQIAKLTEVPVIIRRADELETLELALVENVQREDIGPLECARAYRRLLDEFGQTQESIATRVGKSRVAVANTVRLLKLPKRILEGLETGRISEGHARALLQFGNEAQMLAVYDQILAHDLSVRKVEELAKAAPKETKPVKPQNINEEVQAAEHALSLFLGAPARIMRQKHGTGKITIEFYSDDDLVRIFEALGVEAQ